MTHVRFADILGIVNRVLAADVGGDHFVTLLLARLDPGARSLIYSSAGHMTGYVFDRSGVVLSELTSTSIPLGIDAEGEFPPAPAVILNPGDLVFFYTDGVVEATAPDGSLFGIERALEVVRSTRGESACEIDALLLQLAEEPQVRWPRIAATMTSPPS